MDLGSLVHVPSIFNVACDGLRSHKVFARIDSDLAEDAFFVPQGTPGILLMTMSSDGLQWSRVLYPQGIGWIQSSWLRSLA